MSYEIEFTEDALSDFGNLEPHCRATIRSALETHLRYQPAKLSKSRIKRLRGLRRPQYRLRIDERRVYYDVEDETVTILGIVSKLTSEDWLEENSLPDHD